MEAHPRRLFVNAACDLLKYVRFFSVVKTHLEPKEEISYYQPQITLEIYIHEEDQPIVEMYPELEGLEGVAAYVYHFEKTLTDIGRCLPAEGEPTQKQLHRMYDLTLRLMSQELAVIYDLEAFDGNTARQERQTLSKEKSGGNTVGGIVTLTISEPLPAIKRLTEAVEEHWKAMLHAAIAETVRLGPLPWFEKALVAIKIVTPRGNNNAQVWDTSNRAIQVVLNNLEGIFFEDDIMEHMAFSVKGGGSEGCTTIQILDFEMLRQFRDSEMQ